MIGRFHHLFGVFFNTWPHLFQNNPAQAVADDEQPLRSELLSAGQMEQHGKILASEHRLKPGHSRDRLLSRLADNERVLFAAHALLTEDVKANQRITPAGDWLLDNFYLIEEQIRTARRHLPKNYSRELPCLLDGPSAGFPRVYDITLEIISHGDGRADPENLSRFVHAYQSVTALKLGELWAIPIMLRLALIENLRRVSARITADRIIRNRAVYWADRMADIMTTDPKSLILVVADMARSAPPMESAFVAELTRRLQGQGPGLALPLTWIEQRLSESGQTIDLLVRLENQKQAANQVSVSNSIGSLRFLSAMDWCEFVETMSGVETILGKDPGDVYDKMDFASRDRYRHVVEKIAKTSSTSETEVANQAIRLAEEAAILHGGDSRKNHVGFYLIDEGLAQLEKTVGMRFSLLTLLGHMCRGFPLLMYVGAIFLIMSATAAWFMEMAYTDGMEGWPIVFMIGLALFCACHMAVALINGLTALLAKPHMVPRMDFSHGIPSEDRTLVVIPSLLTDTQTICDLTDALEVRFLGNRNDHIHFSLLTDFRDARDETEPEDEKLLQLIEHKIKGLNKKHPSPEGDHFYLFHRPRLWNPKDRLWMGYERKRGKLADLNGLLRGKSQDRFSLIVGDLSVLSNVRYVITLDTDTQLPRDTARQFVGAMAHPLNRACYDEKKQRVVRGYGILQPRVSASLTSVNRSRYARLCSGELGIDPYTRAVSDVYQDLFGEGSFIGKGIYDVDIFDQALSKRFPENRILSHDLLEGCYVRSGLLSDVQLHEDYPATYRADVSRRHRWIRGDWQIAHWLLPRVPGRDSMVRKNPISLLSRWKILDNLRRSLTAAGLTLLLVMGWAVVPSPGIWTLSVIGILLIPLVVDALTGLFQKPIDVTWGQHLDASMHTTMRHFSQTAFVVACLPYEAFFSLDAVVKTAWRILISKKHLLEWKPSGNPDRIREATLMTSVQTMWIAPALAAALMIALWMLSPMALAPAGPILGLWLVSPAIAWWISRPLVHRTAKLTGAQTLYLRTLARKTWSFFEVFVGPEDHWLPPDNFQEHPVPVVAHRTSPTNMSLALLANVSAYDFGYISAGKLLERTSQAFNTMEKLDRYRGHFYNWYDTQSLKPLPPHYISSVDSGNLSGHLLTLRPGLVELVDHTILGPRLFEGLSDTLQVISDTVAGDGETVASIRLHPIHGVLESAKKMNPVTLFALRQCVDYLVASSSDLTKCIHGLCPDPENPLRWWASALEGQCRDAREEMIHLTPWTEEVVSETAFEDIPGLDNIPTLRELSELDRTLDPAFEQSSGPDSSPELKAQTAQLQHQVTLAAQNARKRMGMIKGLARQCESLSRMDHQFLFDKTRHLLLIGYNVDEHQPDASFYDLLASEARFACFVGIAQGQLTQESWFALGRLLTIAGGEPVLLSWSGSMFEYLMPLLVMPSYERTLLYQSCKAAVARQIEYGKKCAVPWGISESGYNAIDVHHNYQYRAFGVPGLGLKRGLAEDLVIAPYASALALMISPEDACRNLQRLSADGFETRYGFYEAIDYTLSRLPRGQSNTVIRSFMAHHQGMSLLALTHLLLNRPMQRRFGSDPEFQATLLLLQEQIPKASAFYAHTTEVSEHHAVSGSPESRIRFFRNHATPSPEVQLLSNGRYHVMVTNTGGGYSCWKDLAVTRWREDKTCDNWGTFCYIRDVDSREYWSTAYQPTLRELHYFEAIFSEGRAEFRCREQDYDAHTEIAVSPEDDIEIRRIRIINRARIRRTIDVTSYAEVVLAPQASDVLHPAFSNLFVQTEIIRGQRAILCTRRPRSQGEKPPWMFHLMAVHGADIGEITYETDRLKFIGRGNTVADPQAMSAGDYFTGALSDSEGSVLDPIVAIRCRITLDPDESVILNMVSGMGETRGEALNLVEKYQDRRLADRVFDLAWTHGQVLLSQLNASEADAQLYGHLAGSIIYAHSKLRTNPSVLIKNHRGQSGLWGYAISGDLPIVLLRIEDAAHIELVRQLVQAHAYWHLKGLVVDLVIWNEDRAGYRQLLHDQIMGFIAAVNKVNGIDRPGGIFVRPVDQISEEDRFLIQSVARIVISDRQGTLADQVRGRSMVESHTPLLTPTRTHRSVPMVVAPQPRHDLIFYNGMGGFTPDGREYVITTAHGYVTPAPWANVLANPEFGTVISESGAACTFSENAHEYRLTPWGNDPVSDSCGEAFYIRDEERGHYWSPTPLPTRGVTPYETRHGFGYSVFEHTERGIQSELWVYVALDAAVKFTVLKVKNASDRSRKLSATGYAEWVLGDVRQKSAMHVITETDPECGALFARNPYNTEFSHRTAFFDVDDINRTVTGDRTEFIGRNGTLRAPAVMLRTHLSGKVGAGMDPCAAIQVKFDLAPGQHREIIFRLGAGRDTGNARKLVNRFRGSIPSLDALAQVRTYWTDTLGAVRVETPDVSLNMLANGWLLYQTLACRLWARCAIYQSGGAFGFRDQLQDVMALVHTHPQLMREHLLVCAGHQFPEGDVLHWWHPPMGRGVRTKCSDDYLWLPLAVCRYVRTTGDIGVLDEQAHFVLGRPINPDEDSYYDLPARSEDTSSLYEHCVRALLKGLTLGEHGLPLMGSGDWNDGMNRVGELGKGESVWLGFFLYDILIAFADLALGHGDESFAAQCATEAESLRLSIETHGWDGDWYRRAYFDDGSPLGSSLNPECRIDSIAQSWSVLSRAGDPERSKKAMESLDKHLVRRKHGLIQLLDPPFDTSAMDPGYIKGYVPGVRENGGQYTHAAIWATMAFAQMGDTPRAWELFSLINPINHARTAAKASVYKVEPYVVAADVYGVPPHTGRGGWTWYTGSAAWMYRLIMESLLGLRRDADKLSIQPCIPNDWGQFKIHYRYGETVYHITVRPIPAGQGEPSLTMDGIVQNSPVITLIDDHHDHRVEISGFW